MTPVSDSLIAKTVKESSIGCEENVKSIHTPVKSDHRQGCPEIVSGIPKTICCHTHQKPLDLAFFEKNTATV
jgi:hypothetical protein